MVNTAEKSLYSIKNKNLGRRRCCGWSSRLFDATVVINYLCTTYRRVLHISSQTTTSRLYNILWFIYNRRGILLSALLSKSWDDLFLCIVLWPFSIKWKFFYKTNRMCFVWDFSLFICIVLNNAALESCCNLCWHLITLVFVDMTMLQLHVVHAWFIVDKFVYIISVAG